MEKIKCITFDKAAQDVLSEQSQTGRIQKAVL